ncbi:MAG: T9SS type A sorting domain-containing protein, partial [bacterium]
DYRVWCGNYEDWYYRGRTIDALLEIINNPVWDNTIMNMDCAVYEVIELGNLPPRSSTPELKFAFVTGESLKQLEQSVAETWGESTYVEIQSGKVSPKISLYPAPANQNLTVQYPLDLPAEIEIFDINGRKVFQKEIAPKSRVIVDISIYPPGLLFFRITNSKEIFTGKIIHLK